MRLLSLAGLALIVGVASGQGGSAWLNRKAKKEAQQTDFESSRRAASAGGDVATIGSEDDLDAAMEALRDMWGGGDFEEMLRTSLTSMLTFSQDLLEKAKQGDKEAMLRLYDELPEEMKSAPELADLPSLLEDASASGQLEEQLQAMVDATELMLKELDSPDGLFGGADGAEMQAMLEALQDPEYLAEQMKTMFEDPSMADTIKEMMGDDVDMAEIQRLMDPAVLQTELEKLMQDPEMKEILENPQKYMGDMYDQLQNLQGDEDAQPPAGAWTAQQRARAR
jgi:hypothetical protein